MNDELTIFHVLRIETRVQLPLFKAGNQLRHFKLLPEAQWAMRIDMVAYALVITVQ